MTRITIWETPDNREQYRDVPCAFRDDADVPCGVWLAYHLPHGKRPGGHEWRIYRDAEQPAREDFLLDTELHPGPYQTCPQCLNSRTAAPTTVAEPATRRLPCTHDRTAILGADWCSTHGQSVWECLGQFADKAGV